MKSLIFYCFVITALLQGASTTTKIKNSKKDLSATASQKKQTSRRLDKIAKDIQAAEKDISYLEKKIDALSQDQNQTEEEYKALKIELKKAKDIESSGINLIGSL